MAHLGHYISGIGHVVLIGVALARPLSTAEPLPFEVANVSVVTAQEFAALTEPPQTVALPDAPALPDIPEESAPSFTPPEEATPAEVAPPPPPAPDPEVSVAAPPPPPQPIEPPQTDVTTLVQPPTPDVPDAPEVAEEPRQRPSDRVAPVPVAPPAPEAEIAPETQEAVLPDADAAAETPAEAQDATAPEEAASEIVTEAEEGPPAAPERSVRPRPRPQAVADATPETPETPATSDTSDAIADALQEALAAPTEAPPAPSGPPLTAGEREGLVIAVQRCWIIDPGSPAAEVVVTVGFSLSPEGRVQGDVRRISAEGGSTRAQDIAFQNARRAVLRCQAGGFPLPAEKYEQWQEVEITFNPESMRVR